jgi:hypothetical protein
MGKIDEACKEVVNNVEGAVACAVVELETGRLLGVHAPERQQAFNQAIAAVTKDLLRGPKTGRIEQLIRARLGGSVGREGPVHEVHIMSNDNYHCAKALKDGRAAVMLVTHRAANVGLGSAQMKAVLPKVEVHLP